MLSKQRSRLLGSGILLLLAGTMALTACNSSSGTSQRAPGSGNTVTGAESPAPTQASGKGTLAEALANKVKGQP